MTRTVATSRLPALDGLRGCAVLLVMGYHCGFLVLGVPTRIFRGGWIGVDIFFVLSGYLITSGLLAGFERPQSITLRSFYRRRFWRLGPALIVLLVVWIVLTQSGALQVLQLGNPPRPAPQSQAWAPVLGMLTLGYNWWLAKDEPSPAQMDHVWSLAIEEQFYLVWPSIMRCVFRRVANPRRALMGICAAGVIMSLAISLWASDTGRRDFAYFATITRMLGLFLGAVVAIEFGGRHAEPEAGGVVSTRSRQAAAVALVGLLVLALTVPDDNRKLVPLASVLAALCAAMVIRRVVVDANARTRWFGWSWLRWCGKRSYALYLWDWPATAVSSQFISDSRLVALTSVVVAFGCATLSWRFVESRFNGRGRVAPTATDARDQLLMRPMVGVEAAGGRLRGSAS